MSQTIIEKLLKGAEVEWKPIDEIFTLRNGYTPSKSVKEYWIGGTVPWFRMEDLRAGERILTDSAQKVHINGVKGKLFPKDSIIMSTSATVGEHALILTDFLCNQRFTNFSVREKYKAFLDIKYVYYYFFVIDKKAQENTSISSFPSVQMDKLKKWMFPIPTLSVQQEIVRILDAFTAHTAELTAELNERKKQYNYYRDKLLTFSDDEVEWKTVEEIITTVTPPLKIPRGKYKLSGNIPIVDQGENFIAGYTDNADAALPENEYIIFGDHTEYIKYVDFSFAQGADGLKILKPNRDLAKYVYYAFLNFYNKIGNYKRHWTDAKKILLPIVSIKAQKRIVSILDKFDALTTSISEGLPREIELRNKQYEYYRDQLLNFPKPDLEI